MIAEGGETACQQAWDKGNTKIPGLAYLYLQCAPAVHTIVFAQVSHQSSCAHYRLYPLAPTCQPVPLAHLTAPPPLTDFWACCLPGRGRTEAGRSWGTASGAACVAWGMGVRGLLSFNLEEWHPKKPYARKGGSRTREGLRLIAGEVLLNAHLLHS